MVSIEYNGGKTGISHNTTYASPSSSDSFILLFFEALTAPYDLEGIFGAELTLLVVTSLRFVADVPADDGGEAGLAVLLVGLVDSSSEESPPARASNSASRSVMTS